MKDYLALAFGLLLLLTTSIANLFFWQWLAIQDFPVISSAWQESDQSMINWLCVTAGIMVQVAIVLLAFGFEEIDSKYRKEKANYSINLPVVDPPDSLASRN